MRIGDKVRLKYHPLRVIGTIKRFRSNSNYSYNDMEYLVEYEDDNLIPTEDWHSEGDLELLSEHIEQMKKCECGAAKLGYEPGSFHSHWCPARKD